METPINDFTHERMTYWEGFKKIKPYQAKEIETLIGHDLSSATDMEAFEIVTTLQRWAESANCTIIDLKENYLIGIKNLSTEADYDKTKAFLKEKQAEESACFNISKTNTTYSFMLQWLDEYRKKVTHNS